MGDDRHLDQVRKQLEKIVTVVKVHDISSEDFVERDLMLIKINTPPGLRAEIQSLVQIFRGRIVDVSPDQLMIEISGQEKKIEAFIEAVRPYGIRELARTGGSPWCEGIGRSKGSVPRARNPPAKARAPPRPKSKVIPSSEPPSFVIGHQSLVRVAVPWLFALGSATVHPHASGLETSLMPVVVRNR